MKIEKEDERLYLQFLQNNIARMNSNSAQAKGWCIAIVAALLQQEHKFLVMYNDYVDNKAGKPQVYKMPMNAYEKGLCGFMKALVSWSVIIPYGLLLTAIACTLVLF